MKEAKKFYCDHFGMDENDLIEESLVQIECMESYAQEKCREQREACADEITEEEKDDQLIYSQTEAIRSLVKQTPLVTTKTDRDESTNNLQI